ncbi:Uncharacterized conserved protein, DUF58 family, contains vWF domain [Bryocella elongata]|uniref:Uncharacterized conserved protein, DUF58 family, contains vWF domain n=1 Tax=Bryocella elongata TaxID=863522 RepID=A0A1H6AG13_9BACT|nr:DUF58 domain-containing protein [Bryocella elongata]SEG47302.1 Uncharacterized conserved protein, DUF58 family, contains vWF domain [Bryocella elongata]
MRTLIPPSASAAAQPLGKRIRWISFGLTQRALLLLAGGLLLSIPAFYHPRAIGFMLLWDTLVLALAALDLILLPRAAAFTVRRTFLDSPQLGEPTRVELGVMHTGSGVLHVVAIDDLHAGLILQPAMQQIEAFPQDENLSITTLRPGQRGDFALGKVYLRYRSALGLIERWAAALPVVQRIEGPQPQPVRVFPAHEDSRGTTQFYLLRARQIEMQRRKLQMRGIGRDFDSLRDYQPGDELRNVSWTATARRGKLVTRQFTVERSQQVWVVLDAGRLSRTAFELRRSVNEVVAETDAERERAHAMTVTQLDQATTAATMLAQVVSISGDKFGMMTYGRSVQQLLMPGAGPMHVRLLLDLLSQTRSEAAEADHLNAIARLKNVQRRRGLIVWITELADAAGTPELVIAATELARRHRVVLVLLHHPELDALAASAPTTSSQMYHAAAAEEMLERRRERIAKLERSGVLIVETTAEEIGIRAVSQYLEVKAKGMV